METDADPAAPLCAIIVYDKGPAYRRALRMLVGLDRLASGGIEVRPIPWRLAEFDSSDCRALALENARDADLVFISVTTGIELPDALRAWLLGCVPHRHDRSTLLVVALLGAAGRMDPPESPRYQFIKRTAAEAGFDFLAPLRSGCELPVALPAARNFDQNISSFVPLNRCS